MERFEVEGALLGGERGALAVSWLARNLTGPQWRVFNKFVPAGDLISLGSPHCACRAAL